jgi:hypothetical protein
MTTMDEDRLERDVLRRVPLDRRQLVKNLVTVSAFATPAIATFSMDGSPINEAGASETGSGP